MSVACNEKKYKCTVVLPLFNEEHNIKECLLRFQNQLTQDIQLMIIDDGSTDNTCDFVSCFINEHGLTNIELIKKDNEGAARARLTGIKLAASDFIAFIDCDDAINENTLNFALTEFSRNRDVDLVLFDYYSVNIHNKCVRFNYSISEWPISGLCAFENTIDHWGIHAFGVYRKNILFRGYDEAFKLISLKENNVNDDELIARCTMLEANLITLSDGKYYYSNNQLSTTRRINTNLYRMTHTAVILKKMIAHDKRLKHLNPAVDLYILRVLTNISLKHFKWRGKIDNNKLWVNAIASALKEIKLLHIYNYTKKKPKLLIWSVLKYGILKIIYGCL